MYLWMVIFVLRLIVWRIHLIWNGNAIWTVPAQCVCLPVWLFVSLSVCLSVGRFLRRPQIARLIRAVAGVGVVCFYRVNPGLPRRMYSLNWRYLRIDIITRSSSSTASRIASGHGCCCCCCWGWTRLWSRPLGDRHRGIGLVSEDTRLRFHSKAEGMWCTVEEATKQSGGRGGEGRRAGRLRRRRRKSRRTEEEKEEEQEDWGGVGGRAGGLRRWRRRAVICVNRLCCGN